ncbi:hypothetical protein ACHQM5_000029 [Ranunculus cassubicifolius]
MTQLFRSKSCSLTQKTMFDSLPPSPYLSPNNDDDEEPEEEESEDDYSMTRSSSRRLIENNSGEESIDNTSNQQQFPILEILLEALRKSLVTCSVEREDMCSLDIGWPTEVRHVSHVTFDRFNGFLGLPVEFQPQLPTKVPSASVCVFGVSAESMQCTYDHRGNCVPTILLLMQKRLYSEGGLEAEGIFRINAENGQEDYVREQLNRGLVPYGVDVHCLAGLIKAWFRELPTGILDCLTPDQVMNCNTEEDCTLLVTSLPPMEAALLGWAINLMADVAQHEHHNKMNARNIAMVFAPNMTQMADPLTALLHAVQVMNFLKALILKTIREREESAAKARMFSSCSDSPENKGSEDPNSSIENTKAVEESCEEPRIVISVQENDFHSSSPTRRLESDSEDNFHSFHKRGDTESISGNTTPVKCPENENREQESNDGEVEGFTDRLSWRKGVKKLCRHPVFQLSKPVKKVAGGFTTALTSTRTGGGEACA